MSIRILATSNLTSPAQAQWRPTLTFHDPNPPITLETPVSGLPPLLSRHADGLMPHAVHVLARM